MAFPLTRWETVAADEAAVDALAREAGMPRAIAHLAVSRGYGTLPEAERFLNPRLSDLSDPFTIHGMDSAVERILDAIVAGRRIAVFGDYDADGVTATALAVLAFRRMGANVTSFLPHRMEEGYGLSVQAVDRCLLECEPDLVVTVDCGTTAHEALAHMRKCGVEVVVTDHHESDGNPVASDVVNPGLGSVAEDGDLVGVGVAFKLCHALVKEGIRRDLAWAKTIDLREYLDLVAIGTVADVAPITGANRILVRHGLTRLANTSSAGLRALMDQAALQGPLEAYHVGFVIGPRLNAAGRLGSAEPALQLLLTEDPGEAGRLAETLDRTNAERKKIEDGVRQEAEDLIDAFFDGEKHFGLVVGRQGWHPGTVGIVAGRLVSRYRRPAVVVAFDEDGKGRGSCRSIDTVDILEVLQECADLLSSCGGHKMAAGLSVEKRNFEAFCERFNAACAARLAGTDLRRVQRVDGWIRLGDADKALLEALQNVKPFGLGNPTPVWGARGVRLLAPPKPVGRNGAHLRMTFVDGGSQANAIAFNMGGSAIPEGEIDVLFEVRADDFAGRKSVQLVVKDMAGGDGACRDP